MFKGGSVADYVVGVGKAGTLTTRHVSSGQSIQSVVPKAASLASQAVTPLGVAQLGLGVLNLGVSVYNAYQIHKVRKGIQRVELGIAAVGGAVDAGFKRVEALLYQQACVLAVLSDQQRDIIDRLDELRKEMRDGFEHVDAVLREQEQRRQREEFQTRTFRLLNVYRSLMDGLEDGDPRADDMSRAKDAAEDLRAWVQAKLAETKAGDPSRLPWFVALVFVHRVLVDIREMDGRGTGATRRETERLLDDIRVEAKALCSDRTIFDLGVLLNDVVGSYVFLQRSLTTKVEWGPTEEGELVPWFRAEDLAWGDGLEELRTAYATEPTTDDPAVDAVVLNRVPHFEWFERWHGMEKGTYEITGALTLDPAQLAGQLGDQQASSRQFTQPGIDALKQAVLPDKADAVLSALQREFGWKIQTKRANAPQQLAAGSAPTRVASSSFSRLSDDTQVLVQWMRSKGLVSGEWADWHGIPVTMFIRVTNDKRGVVAWLVYAKQRLECDIEYVMEGSTIVRLRPNVQNATGWMSTLRAITVANPHGYNSGEISRELRVSLDLENKTAPEVRTVRFARTT
jgi:hypothetical protein